MIHEFDDFATAPSLIAAAPFLNGPTAIATAYRFVYDNLINVSLATMGTLGRRVGVPLHMVVVTDGFPTDANTRTEFNDNGGSVVFNSGVEVFAVGIGPASGDVGLTRLAWLTNQVSSNILRMTSTTDLASLPGVVALTNLSVCSFGEV